MNCSAFYRIAEEEVERSAMLPGHYDDTFAAGAVWESIRDHVRGNRRHIYREPFRYAPVLTLIQGGRASLPSSAEKKT